MSASPWRRFVGALAVGLCIGITMVQPAAAVTDAAPGSLLQANVDHLHDIGTVGVTAYTTNGTASERARSGEAVLGNGTPVPWGAHVRMGSNTKTFVSLVIQQLAAEHRLSLDDTVDHWLPGVVQGSGHQGEHITLRQILRQTSGIYDYVEVPSFTATITTAAAFDINYNNTYTGRQLIALAMTHAPAFAPDAKWGYSNTNYIVAGEIITAVTGRPWYQEVQQRIIQPLGLTETYDPGTNPDLRTPFAHGYQMFSTDNQDLHDVTRHNMTWGGAAGSLVTTPEDLNKFWKTALSGQLLPPSQMTEWLTTVPMSRTGEFDDIWPNARYGVGGLIVMDVTCNDGRIIQRYSHGGDVLGFNNTNGVTRDGNRSAMVASTTNTFANEQFAIDSILGSEKLVNDALCGTNGAQAPGHSAESQAALMALHRKMGA